VALLFDGEYAPITDFMGFIQCEVNQLVKEFIDWNNEIIEQFKYEDKIVKTTVTGSLNEILLSLFPLISGSSNRFLFIPTKINWTVLLDNNYRGTDKSKIGYLAERVGCMSIFIGARRHTFVKGKKRGKPRSGQPGVRIISVYGPEQTQWLNLIRHISLYHDVGKWVFETFGEPLPFENVDAYKNKQKEDRFTIEMIDQYSAEFGLRPFDEDFYISPQAQLVEITGYPNNESEMLKFNSLKEVREFLRL